MPKHKTKGPLTLQGATLPKQALRSDVSIPLRVVHRDSATAGRGLSALVHPASLSKLLQQASCAAAPGSTTSSTPSAPPGAHGLQEELPGSIFLQLASGSDCVLHTRSHADVPPGCIQVDEVQQANLRLCAGETYRFSIFVPGSQPSAGEAGSDGGDDVAAAAAAAEGTTAAAAAAAEGTTTAAAAEGTTTAAAAAAAAAAEGTTAAAAAASTPQAVGEPGAGEEEHAEEDEGEDAAAQPSQLPFELADIDVEVRLLHAPASSGGSVQVDAQALTQAFARQCFGRVLAVNEYVVVDLPGTPPLLLRVTTTNNLSADEQQEVLGYWCFRGLFTPNTAVYFTSATPSGAADQLSQLSLQQQQQQQEPLHTNGHHHHQTQAPPQQQQQPAAAAAQQPPPVQSRVAGAAAGVQLLQPKLRPARASPTNVVHVLTRDGETFPVKKRLLRPCIALTKAVRDSGDTAPCVTVDVDTLTFDRVLIYLEAYALGRRPPRFAIHLLPDLREAGKVLGLRALQAYCARLLGDKQAALQVYSFADVQRANASGKVWLLLDGAVLDVGRWLPEHPGGATIIPKQSLNCDCARFFEMYHASKESFLYLQEFYVGELLPSERGQVPMGGQQPPSTDFMQQLREFTGWRQGMQARAAELDERGVSFKSF